VVEGQAVVIWSVCGGGQGCRGWWVVVRLVEAGGQWLMWQRQASGGHAG
jgi:hypothetical protein